MKLSEEQKQIIRENFRKIPDLGELTRLAWKKEKIDGRSVEGRLVRQFLSKEGLKYETATIKPMKKIEFTQDQEDFLMSGSVEQGMKPLEIARLVFKNADIQSLSIQHRAIQDFLKENRPEIIKENEIETVDKWKPPTSISRTIKKVNLWAGKDFDELKMPAREKKACEALMRNMQSSLRMASVINNYNLVSDRELFESEFIRATWDKPDLTVDEVNQYITVCANYVRAKHVQIRLDGINNFVQNSESEDVHMRVTDQLKATSEELNGIEKRIESLINKLNGDRAKRLSERGSQTVSILALVEAFQDGEERKRFALKAQMEEDLVATEATRLESMDEIKARIFGISKRELL